MAEESKNLINGGYPLHTFEDLKEVYTNYIFSNDSQELIEKAYKFMVKKHEGQKRRSGEPYFHHPLEVAYIIATLNCGPETIIAGFLHDTVEDTDTTIEEIEKLFGQDVSKLVDSLTKIQRLKLSKIESKDFEAEDHRKIFIGMAKDIRVIIIKLADRLHNMRTICSLTAERQYTMSEETFEVFVPIAHRLGLEKIKNELADLCLTYLYPKEFQDLKNLLSSKQKNFEKSLENFQKRIADMLYAKKIPFEISARVKSTNSIFHKIYSLGHSFNNIYDLLAIRIITTTESLCYEILYLIHKIYPPVPGRFKDYIASPKSNMYQSLHTTVFSGDGNMYEVQIRTQEMDDIAESGVAAHWAYKEGSGYNSKKEQEEIENKLHWFRDFVKISNESGESPDANEYISNLTHDIFEANIYVFTPTGKVIELPNGSTPVDFAYRIHTMVGQTTTGALVNNIMVPLNTILATGDLVEIKTNKSSEPNEGWLEFVKTSLAKSQIKKYLAKKEAATLKEEKIEKGKQLCIEAFKEHDISEESMLSYLNNDKLFENFKVKDIDELYLMLANKNVTATAILDFLNIKKKSEDIIMKKMLNKKVESSCPVCCSGGEQIAMNLASCCTPVPGDEIIGYITKGSGITVHRKSCHNIMHVTERLIDVFWNETLPIATYSADILIESNDRNNLLGEIVLTLSNNKISMSDIHSTLNKNKGIVLFYLTLQVTDSKRLNDVLNAISGIKGVYSAKRIYH